MHDCLVAAAGGSSRMGRPKQLLPFGPPERGLTMLGTVVATALEAGCRVILVLGCRADEIEASLRASSLGAALGSGRIDLVLNPAWEEGMLGSIQAALARVRGPAFFSMNADMPLAPASAYRALAQARVARNRAGVAADGLAGDGSPEAAFFASHRGERGHPVLISSAWIPEILALPRGGRLRAFLETRPFKLVEAGTEAVLEDIDTPEEYRRAGGRG